MAHGLQQVGLAGRYAAEGVPGADFGDRALVAVQATIVPHLQEQRAIAKSVAALDAFGATNAQPLVNSIFVIGVFDVSPFDGRGGTLAIFRASIEIVRFRFEETGAELAIAANGEGVNAFHRRLLEHATGGAIATAHALLRIDLPNRALNRAPPRHYPEQAAEACHGGHSRAVPQELAPVLGGTFLRRGRHAIFVMTRTSPAAKSST